MQQPTRQTSNETEFSTAYYFLEGLNEIGIEYLFCNFGTDHAPIIEEMALKKPGVLRSLVLCDTASQDPLGDPKLWQQRIDAVNKGGSMEPMVEMTVARFLTADTITSKPKVADAVRQMVRATNTVGYIGCCQALSKLALTDRISAITLPTMVVVGAEDPATNVGMAKGIHERIAGSELVILERTAHLSNMDQPAAFSAAVLGFLARH